MNHSHPRKRTAFAWSLLGVTIALLGTLGSPFQAMGTLDDGFAPMVVGQSLEGWTPVETTSENWRVVGDVLSTSGEGGGWLSTDAVYSNFVLRLEYRLEPGGNSGVFIRAPREGLPWLTGMEIQILDDDAEIYKEIQPYQFTGSVYGVVPARRGHIKPPGEWNSMEIRAEGSRIVVTLNGATVVDADLSEYPEAVAEHPGISRESGHIGLQSHDEPVEFRKVEIKALP